MADYKKHRWQKLFNQNLERQCCADCGLIREKGATNGIWHYSRNQARISECIIKPKICKCGHEELRHRYMGRGECNDCFCDKFEEKEQ